jgi:acetyl esterase/lipase
MDAEYGQILGQMPAFRLDDPVAVRAQLAAQPLATVSADGRTQRLEIWDTTCPAAEGSRTIPVRVYRPREQDVALPGLVYFHGGAFVLGDLEAEHAQCVRYATDVGCTVVSVDYRLAPEHPYPAGVQDCYDALCWVAREGDALNVDTTRLAVGGRSAGGALAAAAALIARDRGFPSLALQVLVYPVMDDRMQTPSMTEFRDLPGWNGQATVAMWHHYLGVPDGDTSPYAAPARAADLSGLPCAYVATAEFDPLRDEGLDYAVALQRAGVPVELHHFRGTPHGFDLLCPEAPASARAMDDQVGALRRSFAT